MSDLEDVIVEYANDYLKAEYNRETLWADVEAALAAHDAEIRADAWDEGAASRQCKCAAWEDGECGCGNYPSEPNPYRTPRPHYELFPDMDVQGSLDALTIRKVTP